MRFESWPLFGLSMFALLVAVITAYLLGYLDGQKREREVAVREIQRHMRICHSTPPKEVRQPSEIEEREGS